jgi:hypothetical protein
MDKNIKRFISVDKIHSNYEAQNFKDVFGVTRKAKVGGLSPGKKDKKTKKIMGDTIKEVLEVFIPEKKYGKIQVRKTLKKLGYEGKSNIEPDYFYESLGLIFEFDGPNHYNDSLKIMKDERKYKNLKYIKKNGSDVVFKIIRIPYFVQLSKDVAKFLFKDLIIHFSKELKTLPSDGFYSDKKYQMAISKVYKNMFTGEPAKSENEVLACGLHGVFTFPSDFTEKGIEKLLKDFSFTRDDTIKIKAKKSVEHQFMWSLKYYIDDIKTYGDDDRENMRFVIPTWHKEFMERYNHNIENRDENLLKCIFTRDLDSINRTK